MLDLIISLIQKYPVASSIFAVIGVLRAIFKPIFALAQAYVDATPVASDNAWLDKIRKNKVVQYLEFILDYLASIKLPQK